MSSQIMFEHQYNKAKALTEQKKRKTRQDSRNLSEIGEIREEIKRLKEEQHLTAYQYSASKLSTYDSESSLVFNKEGMPAAYCKQMVEDMHELDNKETLNTSSCKQSIMSYTIFIKPTKLLRIAVPKMSMFLWSPRRKMWQ